MSANGIPNEILYTGGFFTVFAAVAGILSLAGFAFWVWMLVDALTKETDDGNARVVWVLVIVLTHFIGAVIYYFARKAPRDRQLPRAQPVAHGSSSAGPDNP